MSPSPPSAPRAFVPDRRRGLLLAALTSTVWGTVPLGGVVALEGIGAPELSTVRLFSAGLFIALVVARRKGAFAPLLRRPPPLVWLAALGLAANYSTYMWGLDRAGPVASQVLIQTAPLFLIGLSVLLLGERPLPRHWAGAGLALCGVFLVSWNGRDLATALRGAEAAGAGLILLAAVTWAGYAVAQKRLGATEDSGTTTCWIFLLAALFTVPLALAGGGKRPDAVQVGAIVYLCANSVVAYWAFAEAMRHVEATVVAIICTLGPVVTVALVALSNRVGWERVRPDPLTGWKLGGAALVMAGVALAVSARGGTVPDPFSPDWGIRYPTRFHHTGWKRCPRWNPPPRW